MANAILQYVSGFNTDIQKELYVTSKTGVLIPENKKYDEKYGTVYIRQFKSTKGLANYDPEKGYDGAGSGDRPEWVGYTVDMDRQIHIVVDAMDELPSFLAGTESSIGVTFREKYNKNLSSEMDALAMARAYAGSIAGGNTLGASNFAKNFWGEIIRIKNLMYEKGVDENTLIYGFISSDIYAYGENQILTNGALANNAVLSKFTMQVPTGIEGTNHLELSLNAIKYDNVVLIKMPKERMSTSITLLDGRSEGQEAGGYLAGDEKMSAVFVPDKTMFTDVQYHIEQLLLPAQAYSMLTPSDVNETLTKLVGNIKIENIGVNQKRNAFEMMGRIKYDSKVIDVNKDKILCFKEATA